MTNSSPRNHYSESVLNCSCQKRKKKKCLLYTSFHIMKMQKCNYIGYINIEMEFKTQRLKKKTFSKSEWSYTQLPNIKPYGNTRSKYISDKKLVTHHYLGLKISSNRQSKWDARDTSVYDWLTNFLCKSCSQTLKSISSAWWMLI